MSNFLSAVSHIHYWLYNHDRAGFHLEAAIIIQGKNNDVDKRSLVFMQLFQDINKLINHFY